MSKILDEFNTGIYCNTCKMITEHNVQKIDENENGEFIGFYAKCDICEDIKEVEKSEFVNEHKQ